MSIAQASGLSISDLKKLTLAEIHAIEEALAKAARE